METMPLIKVATLAQLPPDTVTEVLVGYEPYAICNVGGTVRALSGVCIHRGGPLSIEAAMKALDTYGFHGASDPVEGAVWRIERNELTKPGRIAIGDGSLISSSSMSVMTSRMAFIYRRSAVRSRCGIGGEENAPTFSLLCSSESCYFLLRLSLLLAFLPNLSELGGR